jgi:hypothetical protein
MSTETEPHTDHLEAEREGEPDRPLPGLPNAVAQFLGDRPIIGGEDPAAYDALFTQLAAFIKPADTIEWIWTKDIVDASWEARRARRIRDQVLELGRAPAMKRVAENLLQDKRATADFKKDVSKAVSSWMGPGGDVKMIKFLARYGLNPSAIAAETFLNRAQPYEQADRMAANADKRRDTLLREVERRRAVRAPRFRDATNIVDAEAEDVPTERSRSASLQIPDTSADDK